MKDFLIFFMTLRMKIGTQQNNKQIVLFTGEFGVIRIFIGNSIEGINLPRSHYAVHERNTR